MALHLPTGAPLSTWPDPSGTPSCVLTWLGPLLPPSSQNLLWAGSALLAPETGDLWAALGQRAPGGSPGSAGLVQRLEEYAATLARNMDWAPGSWSSPLPCDTKPRSRF